MNEKLSIQDLIDLLAVKHGLDKENAEVFVKEFFLLIEQALESDKYVKIKGLGAFKLIDVDSRESVNVNTGERFKIAGHTKVSFTPDPALRDLINKPFSHFETVVLNENTVLTDTPVENTEEETEDSPETIETIEKGEMKIPEETADQSFVTETSPEQEGIIAADGDVKVNEELTEDRIVESLAAETQILDTVSDETPSVVSDITGENTQRLSTEEIIKREIEITSREYDGILPHPTVNPLNDQDGAAGSEPPSDKSDKASGKSPVPYLIAVIAIVLLLCGAAVAFIYYPDLFSSKPEKAVIPETVRPVVPETLPDITVQPDTVAEALEKDTVKVGIPVEPVKQKSTEPVTKKESVKSQNTVKSGTPVTPDSTNYIITGTKATYKMKEGETLTRVSLRFYGTKDLWPYIVKHNRDVIKNPDNVPYGTELKIPELVKK